MTTTAHSASAWLLDDQSEVHFSVGGFWTLEDMNTFLEELNQTAMPLVLRRVPMYGFGDFTDFVPQDQQTADAIRNHLRGSVNAGLKRVAIVGASPLVRLQYKRLSGGLDVMFADNKSEALDWLRKDR